MADNTSAAEEEKKLISRLDDMIELAEKRGTVYSHFLNSHEYAVAENEFRRRAFKNYCSYGLFENAERKMICVYKEYFRPENGEFPMTCITFDFRKENVLSHRDFLGAVMALGIKRDTTGDIVIGEGVAQMAVSDSVKDVVISNISKIGSVGVRVCDDVPVKLEKNENFKLESCTFYKIFKNFSRFLVGKVILKNRNGIGAEVNYFLKNDCSFQLSEGDVFSVKGYGKFRLEEISGVTKKGRIHITVLKYC